MSKFADEQDADTIAEFIDWFMDQAPDMRTMDNLLGDNGPLIDQFLQYRRKKRESRFNRIQ